MTEDQIKYWNQYVNGNNSALGELYEFLFEKLVFRAIYYTKNPETARDIVGELFVSLVEMNSDERRLHWSKVKNVYAFLLTIVRNKCLDYLKIEAGRLQILKHQELYSINDTQEMSEIIKHLEQCLNELTADERKIIKLHLKGFTNHEIGDEFQISEKTVRNKLSLSRKRIIKLWHHICLLIHFIWN